MVGSALGWAAVWLIWLLIVAAAGFPLLHRLLPGSASRGIALAPAFGLLLVSYVSWLLASLHLLAFGRGALLISAAVIALLSTWSEVASRGAAVRWLRGHARL